MVGVRLHRYGLGPSEGAVGGNQGLASGVGYAIGQSLRGKPAEHDRMHGADPSARQHRHGRFRHHRHVNGNSVALFHTAALQYVGETAHLLVQLPISESGVLARLVALPDHGRLVATRIQVPVETVVAYVGATALEPAKLDWSRVHVVIVAPHGIPLPVPVEPFGNLRPEPLGVGSAPLVKLVVLLHIAHVGACRCGLGRLHDIQIFVFAHNF